MNIRIDDRMRKTNECMVHRVTALHRGSSQILFTAAAYDISRVVIRASQLFLLPVNIYLPYLQT
jgi:hypothetical protein